MEKAGKSITTFLFGAAVGVAVGYVLATDKETRKQDIDKIKKNLGTLKEKFSKKNQSMATDMDEEIYHS